MHGASSFTAGWPAVDSEGRNNPRTRTARANLGQELEVDVRLRKDSFLDVSDLSTYKYWQKGSRVTYIYCMLMMG